MLSDRARAVLIALEERPLRSWRREQLAARTGAGDRAVRDAVHELRRAGFAVVSDSGAAGHSLARSAQEVDALAKELRSRALDELVTVRALRRTREAMTARREEHGVQGGLFA